MILIFKILIDIVVCVLRRLIWVRNIRRVILVRLWLLRKLRGVRTLVIPLIRILVRRILILRISLKRVGLLL